MHVQVRHTDDGKKVVTVTKEVHDKDAAKGAGETTTQTFVLEPGQTPTREQREALAECATR